MSVDIFHTRRGMFNVCHYWLRDEADRTNVDKYIYNRQPEGMFYAREVQSENDTSDQLLDSFLIDRRTVTLMTNDHIISLKANCLVKYNNQIWIVTSIQRQVHLKETQFNKRHDSYTSIIDLRR